MRASKLNSVCVLTKDQMGPKLCYFFPTLCLWFFEYQLLVKMIVHIIMVRHGWLDHWIFEYFYELLQAAIKFDRLWIWSKTRCFWSWCWNSLHL